MATLSAWLTSQGVSLVLGWLGAFLLDAWERYRARQDNTDLAESKAQLDQARATIAAQQAELQAQADAPRTIDDAIRRLEEGSA